MIANNYEKYHMEWNVKYLILIDLRHTYLQYIIILLYDYGIRLWDWIR